MLLSQALAKTMDRQMVQKALCCDSCSSRRATSVKVNNRCARTGARSEGYVSLLAFDAAPSARFHRSTAYSRLLFEKEPPVQASHSIARR